MPYLDMRAITKRFLGVVANSNVDLTVEVGEIHALVGENGAGKTTLMKILYGMEKPDSGEIFLDDRLVNIVNPFTAIRMGIGMVHQHFQLVPSLTVAENVALGYEPKKGLFVERNELVKRVQALSEKFGLKVDPHAQVSNLSVGIQQRVEILKLLYRDSKLLILDEPTAVLTPQEIHELFDVVRALVREGRTAILITHKLDEVMSICGRATILRSGVVVDQVKIKETTVAEIARLMVGSSVEVVQRTSTPGGSQPILTLNQISSRDERGLSVLKDISFTVNAGEIVGLAGVEGNGQNELIDVLIGNTKPDQGSVELGTHNLTMAKARTRREIGMSFIPEDRNAQGVSSELTIWEKSIANNYYRSPISKWGWLRINSARGQAKKAIRDFDIRARDETATVAELSGGNTQKVIIARELSAQPLALVAAQPTRGLDIGAARFVHERLLALRLSGVSILLISADLDEIMALSDRIAVIFEGSVQKVLESKEASREELGLLMTGKRTPLTANE